MPPPRTGRQCGLNGADRPWSDAGVCRSTCPAVARRARLDPFPPRALGNRLPAHGTSDADRPWSDASACDSVMAPHRPAAIRVGAAEPRTPDSRTAPQRGPRPLNRETGWILRDNGTIPDLTEP